MSDYLKECDENWIISFDNLNASIIADDADAISKWKAELDRIEKAITDHMKEMEL